MLLNSGGNTTPGSRIIAFDFHGNVNQLFDWQAVPTLQPTVNPSFPTPVAAPAPMKRSFFIFFSLRVTSDGKKLTTTEIGNRFTA